MSANSIYIVDAARGLVRMHQGAPASEDQMQKLVAEHPDLISENDGDLLLITREQSISDSADGPGRWSIDHLFVTRNAIPVLVELKRAVDTRLRREVVGQLLEYAANGVAYWQAEALPSGEQAKEAEDTMKDRFAQLFEPLGGEFFLGPLNELESAFIEAARPAAFVIRGAPQRN